MAKHAKTSATLVAVFILSFALAVTSLWRGDIQTAWAGGSFPTLEIDGERFYIARGSDSLEMIADAFGVTVQELLDANNLDADAVLRIGQRLRVPAGSDLFLEPADAEMPEESVSMDGDVTPPPPAAAIPGAVEEGVYIVVRGDTLERISRITGVSREDLIAYNNLRLSSAFYRGQRLRLTPSNLPAPVQAAAPVSAEPRQYTVQRGDSLQRIARLFNVTVDDLSRSQQRFTHRRALPGPDADYPHAWAEVQPDAMNAADAPQDKESSTPAKGDEPAATADADVDGEDMHDSEAYDHAMIEDESTVSLVPALWQAEDNKRIHVFSPSPDGTYHSQLDVIGLSQTFEGNVEIQLIAHDGEILAERFATGGSIDGHDFFRTHLRFWVEEPTPATLVVFERSMADEGEGASSEDGMMAEVQIPLTLLPGQRFIDIYQPHVGADVCETVLIAGYSNTFEANVSLEITDRDGEVVAMGYATGGAYGIYREFFHGFDYSSDVAAPLLISAYELDASERFGRIDQLTVPVSYFPTCE